jgi:hypothetical protein
VNANAKTAKEAKSMCCKLWYYCKCGFETPISTGMMLHLTWLENQNPSHGFVYAQVRDDAIVVNYPKE